MLTLQDQLYLLFEAYSRDEKPDADIAGRWPEIIRRSVDESQLTVEEWEVVRRAFWAVASTSNGATEDWLWVLSRRFGTANHAVHPARRSDRGKADSAGMKKTGAKEFDVTEVTDVLRYSVLLFAAGLTRETPPLIEGIRRYLVLPSDLRTHFADEMMVMEQILGAILAARPEETTTELRLALSDRGYGLEKFLRRTYVDLCDLLFEDETTWLILYDEIRNALWELDNPIRVFRAHINMTSLNEKDPSGRHGDILLSVVRRWLARHFLPVVRNPERTSFSFIAPSADAVRARLTDCSSQIITRLGSVPWTEPGVTGSFNPEIVVSERVIARKNLYAHAIQTLGDLDAFARVIEFDGDLKAAALKRMGIEQARKKLKGRKPSFAAIRAGGDPVVLQTLDALILKAIIEMNRMLAAQTSFFERERANLDSLLGPDSDRTYRSVYQAKDLPSPGKALYDSWAGHQERSTGFVPPGFYRPSENPLLGVETGPSIPAFQLGEFDIPGLHREDDPRLNTRVNRLLRLVPRLRQISGYLSHSRAESEGLIEQFLASARRPAELPGNAPIAEVKTRLDSLQEVTRRLLEAFRAVYSLAVTDRRHAWTPRPDAVFRFEQGDSEEEVGSNFFLQEAALQGNIHLAAFEYDSFQAYQAVYPPDDAADATFNQVRDALFVAARRMKMPDPVIKPSGGDHIIISFSGRDLEGHDVDPAAWCKSVQQLVHEMFQDRPFQDYRKVRMHRLDLRLPDGLNGFGPDRLLSALTGKSDLDTEPFYQLSEGHLILYFPAENRAGLEVAVHEIRHWLEEAGLDAELRRDPSIEVKRLPMWRRRDPENGGAAAWYFSPHQPKGYEPFMKTVTVSMALGEHRPVRTAEDRAEFERVEEIVNAELDRVRKGAWPDKEGFVDAREKCPEGRRIRPVGVPLGNGWGDLSVLLLGLGLAAHDRPEIGDHPEPFDTAHGRPFDTASTFAQATTDRDVESFGEVQEAEADPLTIEVVPAPETSAWSTPAYDGIGLYGSGIVRVASLISTPAVGGAALLVRR